MSTVLTQAVARVLAAPVIVIAVAVLVRGYVDVGDGFSAGVIAALGLLLQYLVFGRAMSERAAHLRLVPSLAFTGLLLALVIAAIPLLQGNDVLTHLPAPGADVVKLGTLELITAVAFDVAVFLLVVGAAVGIIHTLAMAGEERER